MLTFETERTLVAHAAAVLKGRALPPVAATDAASVEGPS